MSYLTIFKTMDEYVAAKNSGELNLSSVNYVLEDNNIYYLKDEVGGGTDYIYGENDVVSTLVDKWVTFNVDATDVPEEGRNITLSAMLHTKVQLYNDTKGVYIYEETIEDDITDVVIFTVNGNNINGNIYSVPANTVPEIKSYVFNFVYKDFYADSYIVYQAAKKIIMAKVGDVAYWDGSKVETTPLSSWDASLGAAVGVVVVPTGFAPDGKIRIIGLKSVDANGNQSSSHVNMTWGVNGTDTSLTNYTKVPTTDNAGSTSSGSNDYGFLPSDNFTGSTSFVDYKAKYYIDSYLIPSPYLGDIPNPEYYKTISGNNALSDFNGLSNTETLVGLGSDYVAANAAWKYNDNASPLQWYLPGMGELGYVIPRFNEINNTITALGCLAVDSDAYLWSSSEYGSGYVCALNTINGNIGYHNKGYSKYVRPFALI